MDTYILNILIIITFITGYFFITIEHISKINKTSVALLMAIVCWVFHFIKQVELHEENLNQLSAHLANVSQVIFFLLGALIIIEIISAHKGFNILSRHIQLQSKRQLLWVIGGLSFVLSSILDNLTTTIIMVTLLRKLIEESEDRLVIGGAIVIAANAGGAWTPIGDVTTTMLWIGGQVSTFSVMKTLFLPSIVCLITALGCLSYLIKGQVKLPLSNLDEEKTEPKGTIVFWLGLGCLIFVPIFKVLTGLPPFMGMILGLALMWTFTDIIHRHHSDRQYLKVPQIIKHIDMTSVLFFLGILLCIEALHTAGLLNQLATYMNQQIAHSDMIALGIGLISAVVDNVPLVAATMGMYELNQHPIDSPFWNLIAYCAGTGGSILIIGSAAGVAFMGLEKVQFFWYMRRIGVAALVGYFAGFAVFKLIPFAV